jgi:hypothetical protein
MGKLREIVFDCERPSRLAQFWAAVLDGYLVRPYDEPEIARLAARGLTPETDPSVLVDGPGPILCFQKVPGRTYANNRVHLDVAVADSHAEVTRLLGLGASVQRKAESYTVMSDPEGNQFCVVEAG